MKSRSYPTSAAAHDDWLEEPWTVDCICGVNFDDGEEMVNCDECGVWVHTRCSRYVKSDQSFACDKCKSKNNNTRNESEETEVAQLLVELPTKTLRMDNPSITSCPLRFPFKLWTDIPMDERVHVQGIPGGEAEVFGGILSSISTRELWRCSGYVPKKFNLRFREFSCWDDGQDIRSTAAVEDPVDIGAGALLSSSKEDIDRDLKGLVEEGGNHSLAPSKDSDTCEGDNINVRCPREDTKKERTLLRPFVFHLGKHRKEESGTSKDGGGKKVKVVNEDGFIKERVQQASSPVSPISNGTKHLVCNKDSGSNLIRVDTHTPKIMEGKDTAPRNPFPDSQCIRENDADKPQENHSSGDHHLEGSAFDDPTSSLLNKECLVGEKAVPRLSPSIKNSPVDGLATLLEQHNDQSDAINEEIVGAGSYSMNVKIGGFSVSAGKDRLKSESLGGDVSSTVTKGKAHDHKDLGVNNRQSFLEHPTDMGKHPNEESSTLGDTNSDCTGLIRSGGSGVSLAQPSSNAKAADRSEIISLAKCLSHKDVMTGELPVKCQTDRSDELTNKPSQPEPQVEEPECPLASSSLDFKPHAVKMEYSSSQNNIMSSSPLNLKTFHDQLHSSSTTQGMSSIKKDDSSTDKNGEETAPKVLKERTKSFLGSTTKSPNSIKVSHASDPKKAASDSKELGVCSSRSSLTPNTEGASGSDEPASYLQTQSMSSMQNKISISGVPLKAEKVNQTCTKMNHTLQMHTLAPSSSPATLSDEELALLLHQELNSSPRVSRVPRMRHSGNLPQLGSPIFTNMLTKRPSTSGGRDHGVVGRKKNRELVRDVSLQETGDEVKMDMVAQSPDTVRHNSECVADACGKRERNSSFRKGIHAGKKTASSISVATLRSGPTSSSEANEPNFSSMRCSVRDMSDDDTGTICCPTRHTLPGLIDEILSKDPSMTYEGLCNAVLPHWPNLRKQNGDRYAYSSHLQAVLDCLRNRQEWAQLVDRGPKTNAGRKKRKIDAEAPDSEDNVLGQDTIAAEAERVESHQQQQEEFPKGKRQARKRKRPPTTTAAQGKRIIRRRKTADVNSGDDDDGDDGGSFCNKSSSEEEEEEEDDTTMSEEDGGISLVRSEASTSSGGGGVGGIIV